MDPTDNPVWPHPRSESASTTTVSPTDEVDVDATCFIVVLRNLCSPVGEVVHPANRKVSLSKPGILQEMDACEF